MNLGLGNTARTNKCVRHSTHILPALQEQTSTKRGHCKTNISAVNKRRRDCCTPVFQSEAKHFLNETVPAASTSLSKAATEAMVVVLEALKPVCADFYADFGDVLKTVNEAARKVVRGKIWFHSSRSSVQHKVRTQHGPVLSQCVYTERHCGTGRAGKESSGSKMARTPVLLRDVVLRNYILRWSVWRKKCQTLKQTQKGKSVYREMYLMWKESHFIILEHQIVIKMTGVWRSSPIYLRLTWRWSSWLLDCHWPRWCPRSTTMQWAWFPHHIWCGRTNWTTSLVCVRMRDYTRYSFQIGGIDKCYEWSKKVPTIYKI